MFADMPVGLDNLHPVRGDPAADVAAGTVGLTSAENASPAARALRGGRLAAMTRSRCPRSPRTCPARRSSCTCSAAPWTACSDTYHWA